MFFHLHSKWWMDLVSVGGLQGECYKTTNYYHQKNIEAHFKVVEADS